MYLSTAPPFVKGFMGICVFKATQLPVPLLVDGFSVHGWIPSCADKPRAPFNLGFRVVPVASARFRQRQRLIPSSLSRLKRLFLPKALFLFFRHVFAFLSFAFQTGDVFG